MPRADVVPAALYRVATVVCLSRLTRPSLAPTSPSFPVPGWKNLWTIGDNLFLFQNSWSLSSPDLCPQKIGAAEDQTQIVTRRD